MSQRRIELLFSILVVVFVGWILWEARVWPVHSRIFPWSIGAVVLGLALVQLVSSVRRMMPDGMFPGMSTISPHQDRRARERQNARQLMASEDALPLEKSVRRRMVAMCSWILVFFLGVWLLGFRVGSFILTAGFLKLAAFERWSVSVTAGGVSYVFFLLVFHFLLQVPLPPGLLAEALGLDSLDHHVVRGFSSLFR